MHYVKQFNINGIDTKQVACIELRGKPNAATEGYVGVLGIDILSPLHDVYKCTAVNGSIYSWELLSSGTCIMSSIITGAGEEVAEFPYEKLRTVVNYVPKVGDVIIDKEGFLYQVESVNYTSCVARYNGTQIVSGMPKVGQPDNGKILSVVDGCHAFVPVEGSSVDNYVKEKYVDPLDKTQKAMKVWTRVEPDENGNYNIEKGKVYRVYTTTFEAGGSSAMDSYECYNFCLDVSWFNKYYPERKQTVRGWDSDDKIETEGANWFTLKIIKTFYSIGSAGTTHRVFAKFNDESDFCDLPNDDYYVGAKNHTFTLSGVTSVYVENYEGHLE